MVRSFSTIKATARSVSNFPSASLDRMAIPLSSLDQPAVERMLREAAIGAGADLRFGADVAALEQPTLSDGATITGRWVLGSDGARSTVRRQLGIELENQGFDEDWVVVDTTLLDPDLSLSSLVTQYCDPDRIVTYIPGHGTHRRWEFQFRKGETRAEMASPERIAELLGPWALHINCRSTASPSIGSMPWWPNGFAPETCLGWRCWSSDAASPTARHVFGHARRRESDLKPPQSQPPRR